MNITSISVTVSMHAVRDIFVSDVEEENTAYISTFLSYTVA